MSPRRAALLAVMSGSGFLNTALGAAAALIATVVLGPAQRGVMVIGITICSVVGLACCLGTGPGLRSLLPTAPADGRPALLAAYQWFSLAAVGVAGAAAIGTAVLSAPALDPAMADPVFLVGIAMFAVAGVVLQQAGDLWFADGRFRAGSIGAVLVSTGGLAGMSAATMVGTSARVLLVGQAAGTLLACAGQLVALHRAGLVVMDPPRRRDLLMLIRRGAPALGLTGGLVIALRADRYILGLVVGPAAVGIYSLAATLSETARNIPVVVGQMYLRDTACGQGAARLTRAARVATLGAVVTGTAVVAVASVLLVPVFGPEFAKAGDLLVVLVVAEVCFVPFFVVSRGLLGGGWTTAAGVLGTVGGLAAIGAYIVAIGAFAALGAAVASVAVYTGLSLAGALLLRTRLTSCGVVGAGHRG